MRLATALAPVGHQDRLSLVGHLDELRTRLIVSLVAVSVAFGLCFWQNDRLLHLINASLAIGAIGVREARTAWHGKCCSCC